MVDFSLGWLCLPLAPSWLLHPYGSRSFTHYLQCDFCLLIPLGIVPHSLQISGSNSQEKDPARISDILIGQSSPSRPSHWLLTRLLIGGSESDAFSWSNRLWLRRLGPTLLNIVVEIMDAFLIV